MKEPYGVRQCRSHWHVTVDAGLNEAGQPDTEDILTSAGYNLPSEMVALTEAAKLNNQARDESGATPESEHAHYDRTGHAQFAHYPRFRDKAMRAECITCHEPVLTSLYQMKECPHCGGSGQVPENHRIEDPPPLGMRARNVDPVDGPPYWP